MTAEGGGHSCLQWVSPLLPRELAEDTQGLSLTRGLGRLPVGPVADLLHQRLVVLAIEGHGAMHQNVQQNTQGPAVDLRGGGALISRASGCRAASFLLPLRTERGPQGRAPLRTPSL